MELDEVAIDPAADAYDPSAADAAEAAAAEAMRAFSIGSAEGDDADNEPAAAGGAVDDGLAV